MTRMQTTDSQSQRRSLLTSLSALSAGQTSDQEVFPGHSGQSLPQDFVLSVELLPGGTSEPGGEE